MHLPREFAARIAGLREKKCPRGIYFYSALDTHPREGALREGPRGGFRALITAGRRHRTDDRGGKRAGGRAATGRDHGKWGAQRIGRTTVQETGVRAETMPCSIDLVQKKESLVCPSSLKIAPSPCRKWNEISNNNHIRNGCGGSTLLGRSLRAMADLGALRSKIWTLLAVIDFGALR